ncbi:hypothetical protein M0R45_009307 [Rubus argutus]|uniref:Uncharacterized protein n=1 Tax=Rubus argutus TaxID=59490 RepID=A0AAW1Y5N8_RUBAR
MEAGRAAMLRPKWRRMHRMHLRWSPNFRGNTISTQGTFFITRAKSNNNRRWPEFTSKGGWAAARLLSSNHRRSVVVWLGVGGYELLVRWASKPSRWSEVKWPETTSTR